MVVFMELVRGEHEMHMIVLLDDDRLVHFWRSQHGHRMMVPETSEILLIPQVIL